MDLRPVHLLSLDLTSGDHLKVDEADYEVGNQSQTSTVGFDLTLPPGG
jgi:hypothetical protein